MISSRTGAAAFAAATCAGALTVAAMAAGTEQPATPFGFSPDEANRYAVVTAERLAAYAEGIERATALISGGK